MCRGLRPPADGREFAVVSGAPAPGGWPNDLSDAPDARHEQRVRLGAGVRRSTAGALLVARSTSLSGRRRGRARATGSRARSYDRDNRRASVEPKQKPGTSPTSLLLLRICTCRNRAAETPAFVSRGPRSGSQPCLPLSVEARQSSRPAVADIIGAGREATVAITSATPIPDRYVLNAPARHDSVRAASAALEPAPGPCATRIAGVVSLAALGSLAIDGSPIRSALAQLLKFLSRALLRSPADREPRGGEGSLSGVARRLGLFMRSLVGVHLLGFRLPPSVRRTQLAIRRHGPHGTAARSPGRHFRRRSCGHRPLRSVRPVREGGGSFTLRSRGRNERRQPGERRPGLVATPRLVECSEPIVELIDSEAAVGHMPAEDLRDQLSIRVANPEVVRIRLSRVGRWQRQRRTWRQTERLLASRDRSVIDIACPRLLPLDERVAVELDIRPVGGVVAHRNDVSHDG
jgi:hypothetical protein